MIKYTRDIKLYRRNNNGQPCVWYAEPTDESFILKISYGIVGRTITTELVNCIPRSVTSEWQSRINSKLKEGYIIGTEITDQGILPVEELQLIDYLNTYLPYDRQSSTGAMLPQLAKLYDNTNNKLFKDNIKWIVQPKINGLRCMIGAKENEGDLFRSIKLTFQSREGTYWNSLNILEDYLLKILPKELLANMVESNWLLDGELYIDGLTVNEINSCVKNIEVEGNRNIQFWCYDIAIPEMTQLNRLNLLGSYLVDYLYEIHTIYNYNIVPKKLVYLGNLPCTNNEIATYLRDRFIKWKHEGLIGRHPDRIYQYGKRNLAMWKYKATTDGKFLIVDIIPEGNKRDIPLLVLRNDINNSTFNVHATGSFEYQKSLFDRKDIIGRLAFVTYGERSGVNQLPFHVKEVTIIEYVGEKESD